MAQFVALSDTHGYNDRLTIPDGDILLHAGDLTQGGSPAEVVAAYDWLNRLPHRHIIVTPGNHDFAFTEPQFRSLLAERFPRVQTLIDQSCTVDGFVIYGSPWQPWFLDWAFNFYRGARGERQAISTWARIPDDTAILLTHTPPYGILDAIASGHHEGCQFLRERVEQIASLRVHVFGHIHESHDRDLRLRHLSINAAICDHRYRPVFPAQVFAIRK